VIIIIGGCAILRGKKNKIPTSFYVAISFGLKFVRLELEPCGRGHGAPRTGSLSTNKCFDDTEQFTDITPEQICDES